MPGAQASPVARSVPFDPDDNDFDAASIDVQLALEELFYGGGGQGLRSSQGRFFRSGTVNNKWLFLGHIEGRPSNEVPLIFTFDAEIKALSYGNKNDNSDTDIVFYKNGSSLFTWSISDKRLAYKTNGLSSLVFSAGDRLAVYFTNGGTPTPQDPYLTVLYSFTNNSTGEGGVGTYSDF